MRRRSAWAALALVAPLCASAAPSGPSQDPVRVRWLGVAGFEIASGETTLLHDPYLSRHGMLRTLLRRYRPDEALLEGLLAPGSPIASIGGADAILIGHAHFDHLGDAPWLALRTGARLVGSATAANVAIGYGLPEDRALALAPGARLALPPFEVRVVASEHAILYGDAPPLPGTIDAVPEAPIHAFSFKLGDARGYLVTHLPSGRRIFLLSSAGVDRDALAELAAEGVRVDLLLASSTGGDDGYAETLVELLRPRRVVPHHFDDFFRGLEAPGAGEPRDPEALEAFEEAVRNAAAARGLEVRVERPVLFQTFELGD